MGKKKKGNMKTNPSNIYYNLKESGAYGGVKRLAKTVGHQKAIKWLPTQPTYSLHNQ